MDTSKHTVTLPIADYNQFVRLQSDWMGQSDMLTYIEKVLRDEKMDVNKKYQLIKSAMNNWLPEHDLEDE